MARRQRRSARRRNGVGAYQIRFGRLLRGAKLKGKSAAERRASFRKLIEKARSGKASASDVAAAKKANAAYVAKRRARKAHRGGMTRKAYKAMSPKARRMAAVRSPSARRIAASASPSACLAHNL